MRSAKKKILLLVLLIFTGCLSSPQKETVLRVNFAFEPSTLDPRKGGDITSSTLQFMLYEGLVRYAKDPLERLGIAEKIDISKDGRIYTFHLRESKWSDGHPVTAFDFEYAYRSMMNPHFLCPNANLLYPILNARLVKEGKFPVENLGVIAKDEHTLVIQLSHPIPYFLDLLSFCVFAPVPKHLAETQTHWANPKESALISNGPFILAKWDPQGSLLLKKNPHYWQKEAIHIDSILATLISDENTTLQMFQKGELDILGVPFSPFPVDAAKELMKEDKLSIRPAAGTSFLSFNLEKPFFQNWHIRQALSLAIDRGALTQNITQLGEEPATGLTPPNLKRASQATFPFPFDPEKARFHLYKGLEELGLKLNEIPPMRYLFNLNGPHEKIALAIQDAWREHLGIEVSLNGVEQKTYLDRLSLKDFDVSQSYLLAQFSDQMNILDRFKYKDNPKNHPGWSHHTYESLLDQSLYLNGEDRDAILSEAEALLIKETAVSPLYHWSSCSVVNPKLQGLYLSEISSIHWQGVRFDK